MQALVVQQCTACKRVRIKTGSDPEKWSGVCAVSINHLRQTYDVTVIEFTCCNCEHQAVVNHIACTAGAVS